MILGHLVPAGTGFHTYQQSEVRIRPQALEALGVEKEDVLARHFPLLDTPHKEEPAEAVVASSGDGAAAQPDRARLARLPSPRSTPCSSMTESAAESGGDEEE